MILTTAEQSNYKLLTIVEIYNYKYAEKQLVQHNNYAAANGIYPPCVIEVCVPSQDNDRG